MTPADHPDEEPCISPRFGLGLMAFGFSMMVIHWIWSISL